MHSTGPQSASSGPPVPARGDRLVLLMPAPDDGGELRPGAEGVVWTVDPADAVMTVSWAGPALLTTLPIDPSLYRVVQNPFPFTHPADLAGAQPPAGASEQERAWFSQLRSLMEAGTRAGIELADAWVRAVLGDLSAVEGATLDRKIRDLLDDERAPSGGGLPRWMETVAAQPDVPNREQIVALSLTETPEQWWTRNAPTAADPWADLPVTRRAEAIEVYGTFHDDALEERVGTLCRQIASPAADEQNLAQLKPDTLRFGGIGIFSGDWELTSESGLTRYRAGYVGILIDRWNGWAVFSCTRQVADAIVASQQQLRAEMNASLRAEGKNPVEADRETDECFARLYFEDDALVIDDRAHTGDPDARYRVTARPDGQWVVMGWDWTWEAVDPHACDHIVGEIPPLGQQQVYELLPHTIAAHVPHGRLQAISLLIGRDRAALGRIDGHLEYCALEFDGTSAGEVWCGPRDTELRWGWSGDTFSDQEFDTYARACRLRGQPLTDQEVMRMLVREAAMSEAVAQTIGRGGTLARLLDANAEVRAITQVWPAPAAGPALWSLGPQLAQRQAATDPRPSDPHDEWQVWTGRRWIAVPWHTTGARRAETESIDPDQLRAASREDLIATAARVGVLLDPTMATNAIRATLEDRL